LLNKPTESFDAIIKASTLKPDLCEIWYNLGILYEKCSQPDEATIAYQKVIELYPGHTDSVSRMLFLE
jgi:tetratricopeptide (TPR) repeat protein